MSTYLKKIEHTQTNGIA